MLTKEYLNNKITKEYCLKNEDLPKRQRWSKNKAELRMPKKRL